MSSCPLGAYLACCTAPSTESRKESRTGDVGGGIVVLACHKVEPLVEAVRRKVEPLVEAMRRKVEPLAEAARRSQNRSRSREAVLGIRTLGFFFFFLCEREGIRRSGFCLFRLWNTLYSSAVLPFYLLIF